MRSQQLKITPFPEMKITHYEAYQGVNDHGWAKFRAIIPSRLESVYLDRLFQPTAVQVTMLDEDQNLKNNMHSSSIIVIAITDIKGEI